MCRLSDHLDSCARPRRADVVGNTWGVMDTAGLCKDHGVIRDRARYPARMPANTELGSTRMSPPVRNPEADSRTTGCASSGPEATTWVVPYREARSQRETTVTSRDRIDENSPRYLLIRQLRALVTELDTRGAHFARSAALHPTDLRALIALLDAERDAVPATPAWLGHALGGMNSATITSVIDRLERAGLVERTNDRRDRRRVLLTVTERARNTGNEFFGAIIDDALVALDTFDADELDTIRRFLDAMHTASSQRRADPSG